MQYSKDKMSFVFWTKIIYIVLVYCQIIAVCLSLSLVIKWIIAIKLPDDVCSAKLVIPSLSCPNWWLVLKNVLQEIVTFSLQISMNLQLFILVKKMSLWESLFEVLECKVFNFFSQLLKKLSHHQWSYCFAIFWTFCMTTPKCSQVSQTGNCQELVFLALQFSLIAVFTFLEIKSLYQKCPSMLQEISWYLSTVYAGLQ